MARGVTPDRIVSIVLRDLVPLAAVLAAATLIYVLRELARRRLLIRPSMPGLTMSEAWDLWLHGARNGPDGAFVPAEITPEKIPADLQAGVKASLLETESLSSEADNSRLVVRRTILNSAVIALHIEAISAFGEADRKALLKGYEEGMDQLLEGAWRASTLHWIVLRQYARLKYDDAAAADWFHHFMHVARPYIREKARLAREFVLRMDEGSGRFAEIYDELLEQLRKETLKAHPKKRFVTPDLP